MSENSDFIMPELEPQISSLPKKLIVLKESESPKSIKKSKSRKEDKRNQKSIREFFSKKVNYDNVSSTSSQEDEVALKKDHKIQRNAIENSYESNKGFLTSFESFQNTDRQVSSPKSREERTDEKSYTLIASTLHPKKVLKEELKKDKKKEDERKRLEDVKGRLDEENRGLKRKEREWEDEKQKRDREERKRIEREEKDRLEKEKENLRLKEQMLIEKRKQKEEEKEKNEFENKVPLPISSPKKVGKSPEVNKSYQSPDNCQKSSPEKDSEMNDVKTPKKLRKWPPENESPDPKKNFIKKHQEEQEKLHQETIQNSPNNSTTSPPKENPTKTQPETTIRSSENTENSLRENLGYNSGDDVSRYSDDHLNKQLIVKPNTVLAKDGSEDDEHVPKSDDLPKPPETASKVEDP